MYVHNVPTTSDTYINTFPQWASYIPKRSCSFLSHFAINISYQFHKFMEPKFSISFSSHILSKVFDHAFHIPAELQQNAFNFLSLVARNNYIIIYHFKNIIKMLFFKNSLKVVTWCVSTTCVRNNSKKTGTDVMSNSLHIIQYNSANR